MSKHTPGPWLFRAKSNGVFTAPPADTEYKYGSIIFQFDDVAEPIDADLALILAAPDLLEALEDARNKMVSQLILLRCDEQFIKKETTTADAAIAKARGEA